MQRHNQQHGRCRQRGLSLTELMVSLALGAILLAGVAEVFVGMRQSERTQEAAARMQEAGRFAINFLAQDIRMAGYVGCLSGMDTDDVNNTLNGPPPSFEPGKGVQGWEAAGTAPGAIRNSGGDAAVVDSSAGGWASAGGNVLEQTRVVPGTDILRIWSGGSLGANSRIEGVIHAITPGAETVVNTSVINVAEGDILLLSDCEQADWVQACGVQQVGNPPTLNLTLSNGCSPGNNVSQGIGVEAGGTVVKLGGSQYYIGKRGNAAVNPPALFRRSLDASASLGPAEELVEGVADLQILYGENLDDDNRRTADAYLTADEVGDWRRVVSVRIAVLVQSIEDNLVPAPQAYTFNEVTYDGGAGNGALPDDRRLRRVFVTTIGIRNRTL